MHRFNPDHHAKLDSPERLEWQNPEALAEYLPLDDGEIMVEIGSGTGFFSLSMAAKWPGAKVIGADISAEMTGMMADRAAERNLQNVEAITIDGVKLPFDTDSVDVVLLANVFHEFEDPKAVLDEIRRVLKMGGRLAIVDWQKDLTPVGPPLEERISEGEAHSMIAEHDFEPFARPEIYPYHYVLVFV